METKHNDCKYYIAIDVFKGICKRDKKKINADEKACENFAQIAKCKFCINFSPAGEHLGLCMNKTEAYPDMIAKTCKNFEWIKKNN